MSSITQLLALINTTNSTAYTAGQLDFAAPAPIGGAAEGDLNTKINVTGNAAAGFSGAVEFSYKRLDLAVQFQGKSLVARGPSSNASSTDILDDLETQWALGIEAADIVVEAVDFTTGTYILKANPNSVKWHGQVSVDVSLDQIDIEPTLATTDLPGFEYATLS